MTALQTLGGAVAVGGLLWWFWGRSAKLPSIPALPPRNNNYPIPAETNQYPDPPASQTPSMPTMTLGTACPTISTPADYNALAKVMGLPLFSGEVPINAPDDPQTKMFNDLVSRMKTMAGCFAPMDQDDTGTSMPSDYANQSISYK